ncbi:hypothetical protein IJJ12_00355 [bacterium]|nr:hypothetical protein [bacterium]
MTAQALRAELEAANVGFTAEQLDVIVRVVYRVQSKAAAASGRDFKYFERFVKPGKHMTNTYYKQELGQALDEKYGK